MPKPASPNMQRDSKLRHCSFLLLEKVMRLSYIMTPDVSSPAASDDVIIVFLNA